MTSVQRDTALIPSCATVRTMGQTSVLYLELKSDCSCHSKMFFLVFRIWKYLFLDY